MLLSVLCITLRADKQDETILISWEMNYMFYINTIMKKTTLSILLLSTAMSGMAQGKFGVLAGANISNQSAEIYTTADNVKLSSSKGFRAGAGAYVGGFYDAPVANNFFIQPQLLLSYETHQGDGKELEMLDYSSLNLTIPVLASYNIRLAEATNLRLQAGPYAQYAICGRNKTYTIHADKTTELTNGWWHQSFGDRLSYGLEGGVQLHFDKFMVTADYRYSLRKSTLVGTGHESNIAVGLGYRF